MSVVIETTIGDITVDLFLKERPRTCLNFIKLCRLKYYNFNLFHTIQQGFIAQTGDPTGTGNEGSSIWGILEGSHKRFFEAEMIPKIRHTEPGLLSMVSTGKNMIGSQFFFTLGTDLLSLDGIHCVIGEIVEGHDILRKINEAICGESSRPYQDIRITHTIVLEDPFEHPRGFKEPSRSPSPSAERLQNGKIAADEDIDDTEGKTEAEVHEMLAEREAKARATILEIVGDLPDADMAPPENVLFVCKLNPVTTDDDLEIIFSRFGKIKTCEVIRDKITGDSLQYAFVEFEDKKSCEDAYFKMDNVLIDDRRIHVDFSQSVAKIKWKGKGRIEYEDDDENGKTLDFSNRGKKFGNSNRDWKGRDNRNNDRDRNTGRDNRNQERFHDRRRDRGLHESLDDRRTSNIRHDESRNKFVQRNNDRHFAKRDDFRNEQRDGQRDNRGNERRDIDQQRFNDIRRDKSEIQSDSRDRRENRDNRYDERKDKRFNDRKDVRNADKRRRSPTPEKQKYDDRKREDKSDLNRNEDTYNSKLENRSRDKNSDRRFDEKEKSNRKQEDVRSKPRKSESPIQKRKKNSKKSEKHKSKTSAKSKKEMKKKKKRRRSSSSSSSSDSSSTSSTSSSD